MVRNYIQARPINLYFRYVEEGHNVKSSRDLIPDVNTTNIDGDGNEDMYKLKYVKLKKRRQLVPSKELL